MVTISEAEPNEIKMTVELKLTDKQINQLYEEMEQYNNSFSPEPPLTRIEDYIVFLLEILEREL